MATILYAYHKKIQGNVCTDWYIPHDTTSSLETAGGPARVNTEAFQEFLNPAQLADTSRGSCQGAGYTWKQLKFSAWVKPPAEKHAPVAFL
mmetsp:Transcript_7639/g.18460  ORF Transcript_7639/g.18460 Transcript_7639/m.18460 type:complete len:91 (-) Transcript_7639:57-329(-)